MWKTLHMIKGVKKIVETDVNVREGEKVLILADTAQRFDIIQLFATVASQRGAEVFIFIMTPREFQGAQPPEAVGAAMEHVDVIFEITSIFVGHSEARFRALKAGARYYCMAEITEEELVGPSGVFADYFALEPMLTKLAELETKAKNIEVTTKAGTSLKASIEGRYARALTGIAHKPGIHSGPADLEVSIAPVEKTGNGVVIIDAWVVDLGVLKNPIEVTIRDGAAVDIQGGKEAEKLVNMLEATRTPLSYQLCEIGIGLNPLCRYDLVGIRRGVMEAEGKYGTSHIALGTSPWPESKQRAPAHIDCVYWKPTVRLDDKVVIEDGEVIEEIKSLAKWE